MQWIARVDPLAGVEVEPALAARLARARVPRDRERLPAAAGPRKQILLQREDAERVVDAEVRGRAVRPVRIHHEALALASEAGGRSGLLEVRALEIA